MELYVDQCGSAVYSRNTGTMLAECNNPLSRIKQWRVGARLPNDARRIVEADMNRDDWRAIAVRCGWRLRNQAEVDAATARYA